MTTVLNPKYTFDSYVVGAANRLAVTAGRTVAETPGAAYNPLFIYSGSGLGKTHLLMAIGHAAKPRDELPASHWITSSAVANSVSGIVRPSLGGLEVDDEFELARLHDRQNGISASARRCRI